MFDLDLRRYVVAKGGDWFDRPFAYAPSSLTLRTADDEVTLRGPVRVNVAVVARNQFFPPREEKSLGEPTELFSYDLDIPAGHSWTYRPGQLDPAASLAANAGLQVVIRPGRPRPVCPPTTPSCDVPCDYAVADCPDTGQFFPVGCEPCRGTVVPNAPRNCAPSLTVTPAAGGCVRPRYFNGMVITAEDLETHLRYGRLKQQLQNRAMGEGVVWGLDVALDGGRVAVGTGYGVDCCGNDLTVATCYRVDVASLLCDPAAVSALRQEGPQRMHLLLEYVECPQDARPVHGDPCRTTVDRCEMSRVRETVRLRLVPPRALDRSGPIADFLEELSKPVITTDTGAAPAAATTPAPTTVPNLAPFRVGVSLPVSTNTSPAPAPPVTTSVQPDRTRAVEGTIPLQAWRPGVRVTFSVGADAAWSFGAGSVLLTGGASPVASATPPFTTLAWDADPLVIGRTPPTWTFAAWRATSTSDRLELAGTTTVRARLLNAAGAPATPDEVNADNMQSMTLQLTVTTAMSASAVQLPPFPCLTGPCSGERTFDDGFSPFLHEHPRKPGQAAEPMVYALAATYGVLVMAIARLGGTPAVIQAARALLASVAQSVLGTNLPIPDAGVTRLIAALHRLFVGWCDGLLYPGPRCRGEPHGVVIGCAVVGGGTIQSVDPWGGRRWVMHYPLVAHWGSLFGLKPPDVLVSRVASFVCCLAGLPPFDVVDALGRVGAAPGAFSPAAFSEAAFSPAAFSTAAADTIGTRAAADGPVVVDAGSGKFAFGPAERVAETLRRSHIEARDGGALSLGRFAARLLSGIRAEAPAPGTRFVRYTLEGAPDVSVLVPER